MRGRRVDNDLRWSPGKGPQSGSSTRCAVGDINGPHVYSRRSSLMRNSFN